MHYRNRFYLSFFLILILHITLVYSSPNVPPLFSSSYISLPFKIIRKTTEINTIEDFFNAHFRLFFMTEIDIGTPEMKVKVEISSENYELFLFNKTCPLNSFMEFLYDSNEYDVKKSDSYIDSHSQKRDFGEGLEMTKGVENIYLSKNLTTSSSCYFRRSKSPSFTPSDCFSSFNKISFDFVRVADENSKGAKNSSCLSIGLSFSSSRWIFDMNSNFVRQMKEKKHVDSMSWHMFFSKNSKEKDKKKRNFMKELLKGTHSTKRDELIESKETMTNYYSNKISKSKGNAQIIKNNQDDEYDGYLIIGMEPYRYLPNVYSIVNSRNSLSVVSSLQRKWKVKISEIFYDKINGKKQLKII